MALPTVVFLLLVTSVVFDCTSAAAYIAIVNVYRSQSTDSLGVITFRQERDDGPVRVTGTLNYLSPGPHGFHVHKYGNMVNAGDCTAAKEHWNPTFKSHGGSKDSNRHIGDLGNIEANSQGRADVDFYLDGDKLPLTGPYSIVGRTLVIHDDADDLGKGGQSDSDTTGHAGHRFGCGVIGIASDFSIAENHVSPSQVPGRRQAIAKLIPVGGQTAKGHVVFSQEDSGASVRVHGSVSMVFPPNSKHGFHVHEKGDLQTEDCMSTGGHWNPKQVDHGSRDSDPRHIGDLENIYVDRNGDGNFDFLISPQRFPLIGLDSIVGRAIVLHTQEDDLGQGGQRDSKTTGNAGARMACGVIGIDGDFSPAAASEMRGNILLITLISGFVVLARLL